MHFDAVRERTHRQPGVVVAVEGDGGVDGVPIVAGMGFHDLALVGPVIFGIGWIEGWGGFKADPGIVFAESGDGEIEVVGVGEVRNVGGPENSEW